MELHGFFNVLRYMCFSTVLVLETSHAGVPKINQIFPGFTGSQRNWIDNGGFFLFSHNQIFALGFSMTQNTRLFTLSIVQRKGLRVVWTANRGSPVSDDDKFVFDEDGNAYLEMEGGKAWSTNTQGKGVSSMELQDSGNLILIGDGSRLIWQSFDYPTDTLLSNQLFSDGMRLVSNLNTDNLSFYLEMKSGNLILYGGYRTPQAYWSLATDARIFREDNGIITSSSLISNSWSFFDQNKTLVSQFIFSDNSSADIIWAAVLEINGLISFYNLLDENDYAEAPKTIPEDLYSTPEPCGPYRLFDETRKCPCLPVPSLITDTSCRPNMASGCNSSDSSKELIQMGGEQDYFALMLAAPFPNFDLMGCKEACLSNCSCQMLFFNNHSRSCFLFDQIGSLRLYRGDDLMFTSYIKAANHVHKGANFPGKGRSKLKKMYRFVIVSVAIVLLATAGLIYLVSRCSRNNKRPIGVSGQDGFSSQNAFSGGKMPGDFPTVPTRFTYQDLWSATDNFSVKLGQGGFGSVYKGMLPDGTLIAVKKLDSFSQGKKEFQAEVKTIGSIHHIHLVKLKGFCVEGEHHLLAYEFLQNGSLDKWLFSLDEGATLDWETRLKIALGLAKGLAYLHEGCSPRIVHCDIKPENVLLDDKFCAKLSDFGLAKLMAWEQSHVVTMIRGTRGYLAPEWVTGIAISEKSDVYSFGMVLLEIIGGRKNFMSTEDSEKANLPSYAVRMMDEGKLKDVLDPKLKIYDSDERVCIAIKVALWCIQRDMNVRPSMSTVVQMLEGSCNVFDPPTSSLKGSFLANFVRPAREEVPLLGPSYHDSEANRSNAELSGPR